MESPLLDAKLLVSGFLVAIGLSDFLVVAFVSSFFIALGISGFLIAACVLAGVALIVVVCILIYYMRSSKLKRYVQVNL